MICRASKKAADTLSASGVFRAWLGSPITALDPLQKVGGPTGCVRCPVSLQKMPLLWRPFTDDDERRPDGRMGVVGLSLIVHQLGHSGV